jgi:hypothetical protein
VSKRLALVVLATTCYFVLSGGSASATNTIRCKGATALGTKSRTTHEVNYQFTCSEPITAFGIATNRGIDAFDPETLVLNQSDKSPVNGESFGCEGPIPGFGFSCVGTAGNPRLVQGGFTTSSAVCSKKAGKLRSLLYVTDSQKRLAGTWQLKSPKCPKPKPKKKKRSAKH